MPAANSTDVFNMTTQQGIQEWTVQKTGSYKIKAWGADAVNRTGGKGGIIEATFTLIKGEVIKILCGQRPEPYNSSNGSGAGGTFVVRSPYTTIGSVLIVAGGGGGGHGDDAITGEKHGGFYGNGNGGVGTDTRFSGGTNGAGGQGGSGASGAGFLTDGAADGLARWGGKSFVNGGVGGFTIQNQFKLTGGFGGGGAHGESSHGGGGGGYSGGGGSANPPYQGGGGGSISFNGVDVTTWTGATNGWVGEGKVEISLL